MAIATLLALAACSDDSGADVTAGGSTTSSSQPQATTTTLPPNPTTTTRSLVGVSTDFGRAVIELDGDALTVAVADTNEQRAQGLMGVEDLSPLDGMLFVFQSESVRSFWMKDTLIPLDIAFFDVDGFLVTKTSMATCFDGECPTYSSIGAAQYALEAPLGSLAGLADDARLVLIGSLNGSGKEI